MKYEYERDQKKDLVNTHLEAVRPGSPTTIEVVKHLCEGTKAEKINVTFAQRIEEPLRAESPARAHRFSSLSAFAAYLSRYGTRDMTVLADAASGDMAAVLNENSDQGFEILTFAPKEHPLYTPWRQMYGKATPIKRMAQFFIANRAVIVTPEADRLVRLFKQIQVSKHVTMMEGTGAQSTNGVMCTTKIQGREDNQKTELPERIEIELPMFVESEPLCIEVDLLLEAHDSGEIGAALVSADAEVKRVMAIQKMLAELTKKLPDAIVGLGTLKHEPWQYLSE